MSFVGKLESMKEDLLSLTTLLRNLPSGLDISSSDITSVWRNRGFGATESEAMEYFKYLTRDQFEYLVEYYKFDLVAFNYTYENFI